MDQNEPMDRDFIFDPDEPQYGCLIHHHFSLIVPVTE